MSTPVSLFESDISAETKRATINSLWNQNFTTAAFKAIIPRTDNYFRYCQTQCDLVRHGNECSAQSYQDIIEIVRLLQVPETNREDIKSSLRLSMTSPSPVNLDEILSNTIDLAVRLWLMVNIGDFQRILMPGRPISWSQGSLKNFLSSIFCKQSVLKERVKLEKLFNAHNLSRIAGIQIVWTSNLADHLRMQDDDTRVAVFHHAFFLENQLQCKIFPSGLISETQRTLALLFPQYDTASAKWLQRQQSQLQLDSKILECGQLNSEDRQIDKFEYWHDRLVVLKQLFDDAEPRSLLQWWRDRRRPAQWYNFWFAVALVVGLTLLFGLVQSVEGGLQAYKAYNP